MFVINELYIVFCVTNLTLMSLCYVSESNINLEVKQQTMHHCPSVYAFSLHAFGRALFP